MQVDSDFKVTEVGKEFPGDPFSCFDCVTCGDITTCVIGSTDGLVKIVRLRFGYSNPEVCFVVILILLLYMYV